MEISKGKDTKIYLYKNLKLTPMFDGKVFTSSVEVMEALKEHYKVGENKDDQFLVISEGDKVEFFLFKEMIDKLTNMTNLLDKLGGLFKDKGLDVFSSKSAPTKPEDYDEDDY